MTREEAIKILQGAIKKPNTKDGYLGQAIDMAIKALDQEPFINKPCVSSGVCEHDKNVVIDKIRAEIEQLLTYDIYTGESYLACEYKDDVLQVIDKYKAEYEVEE